MKKLDIFDNLVGRGFVKQCSNETALRELFGKGPLVFYAGFDPTADSLHVGSLVPIMAMAHIQRAGHTPICIVGGGTALIGDPSGKTETRRMLTVNEIDHNKEGLFGQLQRYLSFGEGKGMILNNADWLVGLKYIEFLRDIGRYFKVNEMIRVESYRLRLERQEGLSFIEFNYQLLQAYDFLELHDRYGCVLQIGGDDQWGNMVAGTGLIRQVRKAEAHVLTFPLLETANGRKMGKTENGTIWLDATKTAPYDFYQYWRNTDDRDVIKFLKLFTFLSSEEISQYEKLSGAELKPAKERLAFEATKITHGEQAAKDSAEAASQLFGNSSGLNSNAVPTVEIRQAVLAQGVSVPDLFRLAGLVKGTSEARRLADQGGAYVNEKRVTSDQMFYKSDMVDGVLLLRQGKKHYCRVVLALE
ncbi:MAG: tyrosine--tRNA ligase [Patescibacteria group bacterium]